MNDQAQGALGGAESGAMIGSTFGPEGTAIGAGLGGLIGFFGTPKRPKYNIQPEVDANKALGEQAAFGQNTAISQGNAMADQTAAQDTNTAQQYSSNAGTILNTLKSINNNRNQTKQGLASTSGQLQAAGRNQLMGANSAAIDESDKAWNYNVNQPYQNQVATNRDMMKGNTQNFWNLLDYSRASKLLGAGNGFNSSQVLGGYYNTPWSEGTSSVAPMDL